jgi:hypothetical protein
MERPKYYAGQLLSLADLTAEQDYLIAKRRLHNRYLHGWGVVSGLGVATAGPSEVRIEPGLALDAVGNEILVCEQVRLTIPRTADLLFVVLEYAETETAPIPNPSPTTTDDALIYTRIKEGYRLELVDAEPAGDQTGTSHCELAQPLCIAKLSKGPKGWKVSLRGRRRVRVQIDHAGIKGG